MLRRKSDNRKKCAKKKTFANKKFAKKFGINKKKKKKKKKKKRRRNPQSSEISSITRPWLRTPHHPARLTKLTDSVTTY